MVSTRARARRGQRSRSGSARGEDSTEPASANAQQAPAEGEHDPLQITLEQIEKERQDLLKELGIQVPGNGTLAQRLWKPFKEALEFASVYTGAVLLTPWERWLVFVTICTILVLVSIGIAKAVDFYARMLREAFQSDTQRHDD